MGDARNGRDDIAYYGADIGETWEISADDTGDQLSDDYGALPPGRYLVQVVDLNAPTAICWVHVGPYVAAGTLTLTAAEGVRRIPLGATVPAVEYNVRKDSNDRLGAIMSSGDTATVYVTRISVRT